MNRSALHIALPVRAPFRLDLTVDALRRLSANVVDVVTPDGRFLRALSDERGSGVLDIRQSGPDEITADITGVEAERFVPTVNRMLGTQVDLRAWERRTREFPWLHDIAKALRGLKPPRYPSLWEALAHSIVFQQISIHAAASIMRRTVELLSTPIRYHDLVLYPFPLPERLDKVSDADLRAAGLSANKVAHLRSAAEAVRDGAVDADHIERLATPQAAEYLTRVRGIGPWSAQVVLLRGFGRLDAFPLRDSGVARTFKMLSGDPNVDTEGVLLELGDLRGMLYFHLLLGRLRGLAPQLSPPATAPGL
ncbi:MAG: hypothetical protein ABI182_03045 [Candidatus Baltobacteraceae bacterium]